MQLEKMILEAAGSGVTPGGESYLGLSIDQEIELARKTGRTRREIQLAALGAGVVPERYQRNLGTIGLEGQIALLNSRAAVIGAGGLGGLVVELLARMGVGYLVVVDGDRFAE
ncbi:MAG TPA: ThiF family adenylyltransferase, partial [Bacillota bacterium]|nr:ThiF family adenylyltransferase [Bacillota bacterium]